MVFEDVGWNLIVVLQRLFWIGLKMLHSCGGVGGSCIIAGAEVEATLVNETKESASRIQTGAAEHPPGTEIRKALELFVDPLMEGLISRVHEAGG